MVDDLAARHSSFFNSRTIGAKIFNLDSFLCRKEPVRIILNFAHIWDSLKIKSRLDFSLFSLLTLFGQRIVTYPIRGLITIQLSCLDSTKLVSVWYFTVCKHSLGWHMLGALARLVVKQIIRWPNVGYKYSLSFVMLVIVNKICRWLDSNRRPQKWPLYQQRHYHCPKEYFLYLYLNYLPYLWYCSCHLKFN